MMMKLLTTSSVLYCHSIVASVSKQKKNSPSVVLDSCLLEAPVDGMDVREAGGVTWEGSNLGGYD